MASKLPWYDVSSSLQWSPYFTLSYNLYLFFPNLPVFSCYWCTDLFFILPCNLCLFFKSITFPALLTDWPPLYIILQFTPFPSDSIRFPNVTTNVLTAHNLYCISCNLYSFFRKAGGKLPCYCVSRAEDQRLLSVHASLQACGQGSWLRTAMLQSDERWWAGS